MEERIQGYDWRRLGAYGVIYFVWGSTFLAIRVGVQAVPPLLFAATRFATAGLLLTLYSMFRGELPKGVRQWRSVAFLGCILFVLDYGLLFWAERRVASGLAAVMLATIPLFTAVFEATILKTLVMNWRLALTLLMGLGASPFWFHRHCRFQGPR